MEFFSGVLIASIFLTAWQLGRPCGRQGPTARGGPPPALPLGTSSPAGAEAAKPTAHPAVQPASDGKAPPAPAGPGLAPLPGPWPGLDPFPGGERQRLRLLRGLAIAFRGSGDDRLAAILLGLRSGERAVLPFLRRGRLDPDPRVAALAAEGLARFRGRPAAGEPPPRPAHRQATAQQAKAQQATVGPLKVARTR